MAEERPEKLLDFAGMDWEVKCPGAGLEVDSVLCCWSSHFCAVSRSSPLRNRALCIMQMAFYLILLEGNGIPIGGQRYQKNSLMSKGLHRKVEKGLNSICLGHLIGRYLTKKRI